MAIAGGGGQGELCVVHERQAMPVPDGLEWPAAGGVPEVFTTAHDALFTPGRADDGRAVLISGARRRRRHGGRPARRGGRRARHRVRSQRRAPRGASESSGARVVAPGRAPSRAIRRPARARRRPEPRGQPRGARPAGPRVVIGVGAGFKAEVNLLAVMGGRLRIGGSTLRAGRSRRRRRRRGWWSATCCRCSPTGVFGCRSRRVPARRGRRRLRALRRGREARQGRPGALTVAARATAEEPA